MQPSKPKADTKTKLVTLPHRCEGCGGRIRIRKRVNDGPIVPEEYVMCLPCAWRLLVRYVIFVHGSRTDHRSVNNPGHAERMKHYAEAIELEGDV